MTYPPECFYDLEGPIYRVVEKGREALKPSGQETRAAIAGTGVLYFAKVLSTCIAEVGATPATHDYYKVTLGGKTRALDLGQHAIYMGVSPVGYYAGGKGRDKVIHRLYGDNIAIAIHPSNKDPKGVTILCYPQNIAGFESVFKADPITEP